MLKRNKRQMSFRRKRAESETSKIKERKAFFASIKQNGRTAQQHKKQVPQRTFQAAPSSRKKSSQVKKLEEREDAGHSTPTSSNSDTSEHSDDEHDDDDNDDGDDDTTTRRRRRQQQQQQEQSRRRLTEQELQEYARIAKAAAALDNAGNDMFERGEFERAMATYTRALKLKRRTLSLGCREKVRNADTLMASVATSINNISYLKQRSGASPEETMKAYQDALRIKKEILGNDDLSVGKTLNNIGSVHFSQRKYDEAMKAYQEARDIMIANLGPQHLDIATVYSNIGDVHLSKGEREQARERYSEALAIRWAQLGDRDPRVIRLLEKIASIEMAGTSERLLQTNDLVRSESEIAYNSDHELFRSPVQHELTALRQEVDDDMEFIERVKRDLSVDMVKDKLQIIKGMRDLEGSDGDDDDLDDGGLKSASFSGSDRKAALLSVKARLARFRDKEDGETVPPPSSTPSIKDPEDGIDALRRLEISTRECRMLR